MENKILTKEYVLKNGIDFGDDDILEQEYLSDRIVSVKDFTSTKNIILLVKLSKH